MFDNRFDLENKLVADTLNAMFYIKGYIEMKQLLKKTNEDTSYYYYEQYGKYVDCLNRGGLTTAGDTIVQLVIYRYIFFVNTCGNVFLNVNRKVSK